MLNRSYPYCLMAVMALVALCLNFSTLLGQKVGVVLSGGGASGLAHIGFLKALEENNIPIDYITGTSMGGFVGGLYASGYTPDEIEHIFESDELKLWLSGKIDDHYTDYFKKNQDDASWVRLKLTLDSILETNIPTNLINSTSLDFGLAALFGQAYAHSNGNFDSLYVPFRCLASDITTKTAVPFSKGNLATAIRASISYPFYLSPINMNGKLLYDGGLYDNFPVSTLCSDFNPDYVLGCNVSYNFSAPDEDNVLSQVRSMMSYKTNYQIDCKDGLIVEPHVIEFGVLDFKDIRKIVQDGYEATMAKMDSIKQKVKSMESAEERESRRNIYKMNMPDIRVTSIRIIGLNKSEEHYIKQYLRFKPGDSLTFDELRPKVLKLASDEKIKQIFPELEYLKNSGTYALTLKIKKEKKLFISFGGNIGSKPVNEGFVGLQYNYLAQTPLTLTANTYFGNFYISGHGMIKIDVPTVLPLQFYGSYTINKWDYFRNKTVLIEEVEPSFLIQKESYGNVGISTPISNKSKISIGGKIGEIDYEYYQSNVFTRFDTTDETRFINTNVYVKYERNSLNRKQYPNTGGQITVKGMMIDGDEKTISGSLAINDTTVEKSQSWYVLKARIDQYFNAKSKLKFGFLLEGVYSEQPFFANYASTVLTAPSFEPIPESKTAFRSKFRSPQYGAVGLKTIFTPAQNLDFRLEGFMFQAFKQIDATDQLTASYNPSSDNRYFIGSFTILYNLAATQIAVNLNYYDNFNDQFPTSSTENYSIMLHLGFVLFNQKMLD